VLLLAASMIEGFAAAPLRQTDRSRQTKPVSNTATDAT
jgi:hypothetical protein